MKKKHLALWMTLLGILMISTVSCTDLQEEFLDGPETLEAINQKGGVLEEDTPYYDNIILPKGTAWYYSTDSKNEVIFELPEEFTFLIKNGENNQFSLSSRAVGYSCSCSTSGGSCMVFFIKSMGFGCAQNTCTGSCTGKEEQIGGPEGKIVGVLNAANDNLETDLNLKKASLSAEGWDGFFQLEEVKKAVKDNYDFVYMYLPKPDFESGNYDKERYFYAKTLFYGVEIGFILPNDPFWKEFVPDLQMSPIMDVESPTTCTCSNGTQGGNCKLEKKVMIGGPIYYCSGCTTCTMM